MGTPAPTAEDAIGCRADGWESADSDAGVLGLDSDFQGSFGNKTKRAFTANEHSREIITRRGLARSLTRLDDSSVREDNGKR